MESIRVAIRVKPEPLPAGTEPCIDIDGEQVTIYGAGRTGRDNVSFNFDRVYSYVATQDEIFSDCKYLADATIDGFNSTVFAFGMTGSGKSHTIFGEPESPGIVPRSIHYLFSELRKNSLTSSGNASMVFLTYIELYNNNLYDLLSRNERMEDAPVRIHEHAVKGIILAGSSTLRTPVTSAEEALELIARGTAKRSTAATNLNERSSRSHTVITLEVVSQSTVLVSSDKSMPEGHGDSEKKNEVVTKVGRLNLVDLAGSERVKVSGATGQTLEEAKQINKALSVLGDVLNALSKDCEKSQTGGSNTNAKTFIPYRNSKLTMLLKDSLGGNAKTMMIATIRPLQAFNAQTMVTLRYAARTKLIQCNPTRNLRGKDSSEAVVLNAAMNEISELKSKLEQRNDEYQDLQRKVKELQKAKQQLEIDLQTNSSATHGNKIDMDAVEKEYLLKMEEIQAKSYEERMALQDKMKGLISSHESNLNKLQGENVQLEQQLLLQMNKIEKLSKVNDKVMEQKQIAESNNEVLMKQLTNKMSELGRLNFEHSRVQKELASAKERVSELETLESDKKQFANAIQKLSDSRLKHKQRADALQLEVENARGEIHNAHGEIKRLQQEVEELSQKLLGSDETIKVLQAKNADCETLLKKTALKIKELVSAKKNEPVPQPIQPLSLTKSSFEPLLNSAKEVRASLLLKKDDLQKQRDEFDVYMCSQISVLNKLIIQQKRPPIPESNPSPAGIDEASQTDSDAKSEEIAKSPEKASQLTISINEVNLKDEPAAVSVPSSPCSPTFGITLSSSPRSMAQSLKSIEKEMIATMESRLKQLKDAKENFVKYSGILSNSNCSGETASWLSIEGVLLDLQNKCKAKDAQIAEMQNEISRLKGDNLDISSQLERSGVVIQMQDKSIKRLKKTADKSRKDSSQTIHKALDLMKTHLQQAASGGAKNRSGDSVCSDSSGLLEDDVLSIISEQTNP